MATSHELVEMLVDPAINLSSSGPDAKTLYAYEAADPVEEVSFTLDGIRMTDFVYPSYFGVFRKPGSDQFDYVKKVNRPFQILRGGYQIIFRNGRWSQIYGSGAKARRFRRENPAEHRSEYRGHTHARKCRSKPNWGKIVKRY